MGALYQDRLDAGQQLAAHLQAYAQRQDVLVLALPRGGVPVGFAVAQRLDVPLDVLLVRKLGVPGQEELGFGAIATGNIRVLNDEVVEAARLSPETIERITQREQQELLRREKLYRANRPFPDLRDRVIILVDDGLATGASMRAAAWMVRTQQPARVVVAVPVAALSTREVLQHEVDEAICARTPEPFYGVGYWYRNFAQTSDQEVYMLLEQARHVQPVAGSFAQAPQYTPDT